MFWSRSELSSSHERPPGRARSHPATTAPRDGRARSGEHRVRCFAVVGTGGVVLVDTGPPGTGAAIGEALARVGAAWSDVTDIVLTHRHFDHIGGLAESAELASGATVLAGADDAPRSRSRSAVHEAGPRRLKVGYGSEAARSLYVVTGFKPTATATLYRRSA